MGDFAYRPEQLAPAISKFDYIVCALPAAPQLQLLLSVCPHVTEGCPRYRSMPFHPSLPDAFAWINGGCNGCYGDVVYDSFGQCQYPNGSCTTFSDGTRQNPICPAGTRRCDTEGNFTILSPEPADPQFYQQVSSRTPFGSFRAEGNPSPPPPNPCCARP